VAALQGRAAVAGPRVRVVVGDDVGAVGDAPAVGGQVVGEQGLLAAEEQQPVEAARFEVGAAADHRTAGQEAQDLGAGEVGGGTEGRAGEDVVHRVRPLVRADQGAGGDEAEPGVGVEQLGRPAEGAGGPPGVVVAERHVGRAEGAGTVVAGQGAVVDGQRQHPHLGEVAGEHGAGVVGGGVVGDEDLGPLGQREEVAQGDGEPAGAVPGGDDDAERAGRGRSGHGMVSPSRGRGPGSRARASRTSAGVMRSSAGSVRWACGSPSGPYQRATWRGRGVGGGEAGGGGGGGGGGGQGGVPLSGGGGRGGGGGGPGAGGGVRRGGGGGGRGGGGPPGGPTKGARGGGGGGGPQRRGGT